MQLLAGLCRGSSKTLTHCAMFPEGRCAELNRLFCTLPHQRFTEAAKAKPAQRVDWRTNVQEAGKRLRCKECKHIGAKITISGRGDRRIRPEMSFSAYTELFAGVLQSATTARFMRSAVPCRHWACARAEGRCARLIPLAASDGRNSKFP